MKIMSIILSTLLALTLTPVGATAAESGGGGGHEGGGSSSGCGDVLGDLIHIKRDAVTGQPILQKRWIEYPQDVLGWGYCPIPITETGEEIGFVDLSCDPLDTEAVVEVDYFGRLSGGRTKERNSRMHFNEVISSIKSAERVRQDATGRLELGYQCTPRAFHCAEWGTIDSPMENLALYTRLMKYGHLQTDPLEVDAFAHGDPAAGVQYHPALAAEDWLKFSGGLRHLLPGRSRGKPTECFGENFNPRCADPASLTNQDFIRAGSFLAGAANKDGKITVDLVQYLNRILKITLDTESTVANVNTLPALIRDCGEDWQNPLPADQCDIIEAPQGLPSPAHERFVNFGRTDYTREGWQDQVVEVLTPLGSKNWVETTNVQLLDWLEFINGDLDAIPVQDVTGFIAAASDSLRAIEFVHNYEIPEDLGWDFN